MASDDKLKRIYVICANDTPLYYEYNKKKALNFCNEKQKEWESERENNSKVSLVSNVFWHIHEVTFLEEKRNG